MEGTFDFKTNNSKSEIVDISKLYDIIIVGGGPAGLTAAIYAGRSKLDSIVLEKFVPGGEITTSEWVENYPGFPEGISGIDLAERFKKQAIRFGSHIFIADVKKIAKENNIFLLQTEHGILKARTVIYAAGATPVKLQTPDEEKYRGKGVSYCATCDAAFFKDKKVAVIGGGDTAAHEAIYLTKFANKVILIHRRKELRANKAIQDEVFNNPKIETMLEFIPIKIIGERKVEGLEIENVISKERKIIDINGIFVAIGTIPNTEIVRNLVELDEKGYVIVNARMESSLEGFYAAGDVRNTPLKQVITACGDGAIAAFQAEQYLKKILER